MAKEPVPGRGKPAPAPPKVQRKPKPSLAETLDIGDVRETHQGRHVLAQTEEFNMPPAKNEDEAADFLLSDDDASEDATAVPEPPPTPKAKGKPQRPAAQERTQAVADEDDDEVLMPAKSPAAHERTQAFEEPEDADEEKAPEELTQAMDDEPPPVKKSAPPAKGKSTPPAPAAGKAGTGGSTSTGKQPTLGDYKLTKKLGQGGMGAVFKAHQVTLDREVAVKVLSKELAAKPAFVQRFLREARVMAKLDHPNILRCFDVGAANGFHYIAMEFVDGGSIEGYLKKLGQFSLGDALHIILKICAALDHAHELNLIHRDIKPDNILLTGKGVIKVADLGLAKATDDDMSLTKTGTGAGTPIYMAPEQARDVKHVDGRVDIYALGCMLYVFLTGQAPFKGETLVELIEAKEKGKYPPMRTFNDEVPERLDLIVDKMLAKKPEHRYSTCAEIINDLEGLGLAHDSLGFLNLGKPPSTQTKTPPSKPPASKTASAPAPTSTKKPATNPPKTGAAAAASSAQDDGDFWYWKYSSPEGRSIIKKLTKDQLTTLIKSGSIDVKAQVSTSRDNGYRAVGAINEFAALTKGQQVKSKADRKGEKFRGMYEQIEKEDARRRRWRWFHNLYLKAGGFLGFLIWLVILAGIIVGGYFGVKWIISMIGEKVQQAGGL